MPVSIAVAWMKIGIVVFGTILVVLLLRRRPIPQAFWFWLALMVVTVLSISLIEIFPYYISGSILAHTTRLWNIATEIIIMVICFIAFLRLWPRD